ncbi:hypothetical protein O181_049291 [Austropuccinia psidii MF-1]|uniref:Integrase catalytic domain-containing protein n=1 Tax=Austropuccinia psidii MF-1 TaxID=1389203 RepID=A0A9Q3HL82_9BASI|nr:hypothetical protein [Austropuccinia psidii MF-1]
MIKIQEPNKPWEIVYMDCITGLPPGGDRSYNACLLRVGRLSKTSISQPCHRDDTAIDTALLMCNRPISWTGIFTNIISDRDPKFNSVIWKNLHQLFGTKLSFSTAYHPQTDGLAENFDGFTHDWCTLLPALELAYETSIHASTNQTPAILEKGWNPKLNQDSLRKDLVEIHLTAGILKGML